MALQNTNLNKDDDIPAYTEIPMTNHKIKEKYREIYAAKRVIKLFISHLLDPETVKSYDKLEKHFFIKDIVFRNIMIKGVIVGLQFLNFKEKKRTLISVDDGTGVLDCYVEKNKFLETTRSDIQNNFQDTEEMFIAVQSENVMLKAALMMLQSSKDRLNQVPNYQNLKLGETVELIGTLSEYNDKRCCFVSAIIKSDTVGNAYFLEHVDNLYETYFKH